jgi:hypothetical protein
VRARIAGWQIADGEIEAPVPGSVLDRVALRLSQAAQDSSDHLAVIEGTISWARFDDENGFMETVVAAEGFNVLTQEPATAADPVPAIGTSVRRTGRLHSVGSYEFDAFGLPDVTQAWMVLAVEPVGIDDFMVDIDPVEFRFNV